MGEIGSMKMRFGPLTMSQSISCVSHVIIKSLPTALPLLTDNYVLAAHPTECREVCLTEVYMNACSGIARYCILVESFMKVVSNFLENW